MEVLKRMSTEKANSTQPLKEQRAGYTSVLPNTVGGLAIPAARFAIFFTALAWIGYLVEQGVRLNSIEITTQILAESFVYLATVTMLALSCLAYLISRLGHYERIKNHRRVPRSTIEDFLEDKHPSLTVLVPSYREEERVNRYTLLSAGLQEYPALKIVLLLDDPPNTDDAEHLRQLQQSRQLTVQLNDQLRVPYLKFTRALKTFESNNNEAIGITPKALNELAAYYDDAADWFTQERQSLNKEDHVDEFFANDLLQRMAVDLHTTANALRAAAEDPDAYLSRQRVKHLYTRLVNIFQAEFSSFERKQYASLSHEPNKAMNLNSYIGLMGGSYCSAPSPRGPVLLPAGEQIPDLVVPDSDYLLTLDADSILLPEYCLRLIYIMEQKENARIAVSQTPYKSFRGATSKIERIASATTDIQHVVHQGLEKHHASFWVGANAIIRKSALMELEEQEDEGGFLIKRFINDRTVIEDTESSINLRARGWEIYNYPERLSYSATPPDFGTLAIQRQRWANGGLIIFPTLIKLWRRKTQGQQRISATEFLLRATYLASIAWTSISLCVLFFYPFEDGLLSRAAILTALPYFLCMTFDLKWLGYRKRDIFQIYGLNLLLLPINIAGTIQSVVQIIGGHKLAFARTPKIQNRTPGPLTYLLIPLVLIVWSIWTLRNDVIQQDITHLILNLINLTMLTFACLAFIGLKQFFVDIFYNLRNFVYIAKTVSTETTDTNSEENWASVLYVGNIEAHDKHASTEIAHTKATDDYLALQSKKKIPVADLAYNNASLGG